MFHQSSSDKIQALRYLALCVEVPHHDGAVHGGGHHHLLVGAEVDRGHSISVALELLVKLRVGHCREF